MKLLTGKRLKKDRINTDIYQQQQQAQVKNYQRMLTFLTVCDKAKL